MTTDKTSEIRLFQAITIVLYYLEVVFSIYITEITKKEKRKKEHNKTKPHPKTVNIEKII